jgi:PAS domain S-box-containing protein
MALTILLVDSSLFTSKIIADYLKNNGYEVTVLSDFDATEAAFVKSKFDLVLINIEIPRDYGVQAIRKIRQIKIRNYVPIMAISGKTDDESLLDFFMAGADQVIYKPIQLFDLEIRIQSVMRLMGQQRSAEALIESVMDGVVRIDRIGCITSFNRAAEKMFGYQADEVLGQNVKMLMPQPFRDAHDEYIGNYVGTGQAKIIGKGREVVGLRKSGQTFPLHLGVTEVHSHGETYFVGLVRDMTIEKRFANKGQ